MAIKLPAKICSFDIETENTNFKNPEKSKLILAGIKVYNLHKNHYYPCKYKVYYPNQIGELEDFLKHFSGLIIGHNIFQFDYRVLRRMLSLSGVIEKSVDTLFFLYKKIRENSFKGLSLDNLSRLNLGKKKTLNGKSVCDLWHAGKRKMVLEYNENDCALAKGIWWLLAKERFIDVSYYDKREYRYISRTRKMSRQDINYLLAKKPFFTFEGWVSKIEKDGYILERRERYFYIETDLSEYMPFDKCPKCGSRKIVKIDELREGMGAENMTDGQLAEYMQGTWGTIHCLSCGNLEYYD